MTSTSDFKFKVGDILREGSLSPYELYEVRAVGHEGDGPWYSPYYYLRNVRNGKMYSVRKELAESILSIYSKIEDDEDDLYI